MAPDRLPRSPSGRVPQWVIDEAMRAGDPTDERLLLPVARPPRQAHGRTRVLVVALLLALSAGWWLLSGPPLLRDGVATSSATAARAPHDAPPEVVALADAAYLSDEGRELFFGARPEILDERAFLGRCGGAATSEGARDGGVVGCYQPGTDSIVLYEPADVRLGGLTVESAAHETLHAAWMRLTADEHEVLAPLLEAEIASLPADDDIHAQITGSVGSHQESRLTELFAYVGTQVWRDGGLPAPLESVYARFIWNRSALVAVHTGQEAVLDAMSAEIAAALEAVAAEEHATASERLEYQRDAATLALDEGEYQATAAEVAAMPEESRRQMRLGWTWSDGTVLAPAPVDEALAAAAALLARDQAALAARDAALRAAEDALVAERARIAALTADLEGLLDQRVPG